jgi:glycine/D-amino acid oxidase-like deaminating enzyme/nitrite reductase/ring-hydroxylating ferredoxin subunit
MKTTSYWAETAAVPSYSALARDMETDVVVIGGGITGITTAYLLKQAGRKVVLLDRGRFASMDTAHTTAHLTYVTDRRLYELVHDFGRDPARHAWEAQRAAIRQIGSIARDAGIPCEFSRVHGYLHAPLGAATAAEKEKLVREAETAHDLGFQAVFEEHIPYFDVPGVRFADQAKFHPLKYLEALLRSIPGNGCHVFEETEVSLIGQKSQDVTAGGHTIRCGYIVMATHNPITGAANPALGTLFQTKLFLYTSYVVGARVATGMVPEADYWNTLDPYDYLRVDMHEGFDYLIFGGEDHKTGQVTDTAAVFRRLEDKLRRQVPGARVEHHWSGQVIETKDGLPYIGEAAPNQFVATGFAGNGTTFGTVAAMMAADRVMDRPNSWKDTFDVHRNRLAGTWTYLRENKDYPFYFLRMRWGGADGRSINDLQPGEGKILQLGGRKVAAYRDERDQVTLCSPVCTHMKCIVAWNGAEKTWDCPCHGSRFKATGEVISGPATESLRRLAEEDLQSGHTQHGDLAETR